MKFYYKEGKKDTGHIFMGENVTRSARIETMREALLEAVPQISSDRAVLVTEAYRKYNSETIYVKRAKAFAEILEKLPITILEGELIVGSAGEQLRCAQIFPEFGFDWLIEELDGNPMRPEERPGDKYEISEKDEEALRSIAGYWKNNNHEYRCKAVLPEETHLIREMGVTDSYWLMIGGEGHLTVNLKRVVREGLEGYMQRAKERISRLDLADPDQAAQKPFLESVVISCGAAIAYAGRYAVLARSLAAKEEDGIRRRELLQIADVCERVPAKPARNFHEALQSVWFINLCIQLENNGHSISLGRLDQNLIEYYERDIRDGVLTQEDALELLECLYLKLFQLHKITSWGNTKSFSGYQLFQNITIGGQDKNGKDVTNELSYLILGAQAAITLHTPSISLRYHDRLPDQMMYAAMDVVRIGGGQPAIYSDEVYIPALVNRGIPWDDAVDYSVVGCVEAIVEGKQTGRPNGAGFVNLQKIMELALYGGKDPNTGICLHPGRGDLNTFASYEELYEAFKEQIRYYFRYQVITDNIIDSVTEKGIADPFVSCLVDDCIDRGKTMKEGGAIYDYCGPLFVGAANVGNTLAALKKLVFDEKKLTGEQVMHGMQTNFEDLTTVPSGPEIQKMLLDAPKYGNDDDYVDDIMVDYFRFVCEEVVQYKTTRSGRGPIGCIWQPSTSSVSSNVPCGECVGATPDGRKAGEALADTASPTHGTDTKGITASLKSVGKLPTILVSGGQLLNVKIMPAMLEGMMTRKMVQVLRTYLGNYKGMHVQINCVSADTLKAAQERPGEYKDLMVRVAGYSALFTPLDKALQDDIIARTEHSA